jgi:hypothetical protein
MRRAFLLAKLADVIRLDEGAIVAAFRTPNTVSEG